MSDEKEVSKPTYTDFMDFCDAVMLQLLATVSVSAKNKHVDGGLLLHRHERFVELARGVAVMHYIARYYNPNHTYDKQDIINFGYHLLRED